MNFGDRLKAARINKGMTQEQLAAALGIAKSTLTGYEKGNREPDVFKIKKLAETLDVDANYLLGIEKSSPDSNASEEDILKDATDIYNVLNQYATEYRIPQDRIEKAMKILEVLFFDE